MTKGTLLIGALPRVIVPIARSLKRHGIPVHAVSLLGDMPPVRSKALVSFNYAEESQEDPASFLAQMKAIIGAQKIDTIIPCGDEALWAIASCDTQIRKLAHVCCPPPEVTRRVLNKQETLALAQSIGIRVPREYHLAGAADLDHQQHAIRFPVIAKPRSKQYELITGIRFERFNTPAELRTMFERFPEFGAWFLVQEYIPGHGLGVEVLMHQGNPISMFQHRRVKELPLDGGVSVSAVSEAVDPRLGEAAVDLLRTLHWEGVAMVEFRHDPCAQESALMEVNGRFWGSMALSGIAGVDFPLYVWRIAHGLPPEPPVSYRIGAKFRWLAGDIARMTAVLAQWRKRTLNIRDVFAETGNFLRDFFPPARDSIWAWWDPAPAWDELRRATRSFAASIISQIARVVLPGRVAERLRQASELDRYTALRYLWLAINPTISLRDMPRPLRSVVFVCHGNIIRSPMAEALFRHELGRLGLEGEIKVCSAGMQSTPGRPADPRAIMAAESFGIDLSKHRAQPFTQELANADLLVVMDHLNYVRLTSRFPEVRRKVLLLGAVGPRPRAGVEIADPYMGGLHEVSACFNVITQQVSELAALVRQDAGSLAQVASSDDSAADQSKAEAILDQLEQEVASPVHGQKLDPK